MEREPRAFDPRLIRAARSLVRNRALQVAAERRIERAEANLRGYLYANGLTQARFGAFRVELLGEDVHVTRLADDGWRQLSFRERVLALEARLAAETTALGEGGPGQKQLGSNDERF